MPSLSHAARRLGAVTALSVMSVIGLATAASAHVTVNPKTAEQGSYTKATFRVPNERDNASTTKLVVNLPAEHPLPSVSVRPVPGWTVKVDKSKLATPMKIEGGELTEAVTKITWSGGKIDPGNFQEFDVSMGPLPTNTDQLMFKADQTYSNGEVVKWDAPTTEGAAEPEHPAPVLKLVPKGSTSVNTTSGLVSKTTPKASESADDGTARLLGGIGIGVGVLSIAVGGYGLTRARSRS
ncbi:YcnI family protein [Actinomadura meridiana]|uniref:YcnI family protein n=1 Tax=Actinomadura meridiana TaxID=559626 RepID=A0ABP8CIV7_9ACTN